MSYLIKVLISMSFLFTSFDFNTAYSIESKDHEFSARLILKDDSEMVGYIKNFGTKSSIIYFRKTKDDKFKKINSIDISVLQMGRSKDNSGAWFRYLELNRFNPNNEKSKLKKPVWFHHIFTCGDLEIYENFVEIKQNKKGLILKYSASYPSDFVVKKEEEKDAFLLGLGYSRIEATKSVIVTNGKLNKKLMNYYFKEYPSVLDKIEQTEKKLDYDSAIDIIYEYCDAKGHEKNFH